MKRLAILATFALVMGTSAVIADGCAGSNCAADEPIVNTPPQERMDGRWGNNCAQPELVGTQIAGCGGRCARPEPDPDLADWVTANTA